MASQRSSCRGRPNLHPEPASASYTVRLTATHSGLLTSALGPRWLTSFVHPDGERSRWPPRQRPRSKTKPPVAPGGLFAKDPTPVSTWQPTRSRARPVAPSASPSPRPATTSPAVTTRATTARCASPARRRQPGRRPRCTPFLKLVPAAGTGAVTRIYVHTSGRWPFPARSCPGALSGDRAAMRPLSPSRVLRHQPEATQAWHRDGGSAAVTLR